MKSCGVRLLLSFQLGSKRGMANKFLGTAARIGFVGGTRTFR